MSLETISVRVKSITWETEIIRRLDLRPVEGDQLPAFTAGAHIDLRLSSELIRSNSLANDQAERHRYVIGVLRDAAGRGGSRFVHERLGVGDILRISPPKNNFALAETAPHSVLIAGGIGITPMLSMLHRLAALGHDWSLHYGTRSRAATAFLDRLSAWSAAWPERIKFHFNEENSGRFLDTEAIVAAAPAGTHFYCCGPRAMLDGFERATAMWPREQVHVEYFAPHLAAATERSFVVELARSARTIIVPSGTSILQSLLDAGIEVAHSCEQGLCGACETRVLAGLPDHRDAILSERDRAANDTMMICCSGAKSDRLVLDI
jgi:ferredoxin-NADP reductase